MYVQSKCTKLKLPYKLHNDKVYGVKGVKGGTTDIEEHPHHYLPTPFQVMAEQISLNIDHAECNEQEAIK